MELIALALIAFILRRPAVFLVRLLAWVAVGVAVVLMILSVATGTSVPTGVLLATLATILALRWASRRRGTLRSPAVV